jgi:hypothetical protein
VTPPRPAEKRSQMNANKTMLPLEQLSSVKRIADFANMALFFYLSSTRRFYICLDIYKLNENQGLSRAKKKLWPSGPAACQGLANVKTRQTPKTASSEGRPHKLVDVRWLGAVSS